MKFFFDRNISIHIARMMSHFDRDNTIVHQDDDARFADNDDDVSLINTVKNDDPQTIWVTADIAQKRVPQERAALRDSGMSIVFFKRFHKGVNAHYQAMKVLAVWPNLCNLCERTNTPTAFEVPAGKFTSDKIDRLGATSEVLG